MRCFRNQCVFSGPLFPFAHAAKDCLQIAQARDMPSLPPIDRKDVVDDDEAEDYVRSPDGYGYELPDQGNDENAIAVKPPCRAHQVVAARVDRAEFSMKNRDLCFDPMTFSQ